MSRQTRPRKLAFRYGAMAVAAALAVPAAHAQPADVAVVVDGQDRGRVFDGIGGVSAGGSSRLLYDYPEPQRGEILDYLFKPGYGQALQILKVEIGGDVNGTVGAEPSHMRERGEVNGDRGFQWWLMTEARKRNPDIKLAGLQWGAPGWFDGGFWSQDNIDYLIAWLDLAKQRGLAIDYMGGWNESGYELSWFADFDEALREKYPDVQVVAADTSHTSEWNVVPRINENPAYVEAIDVIGVHGPGGSRTNPLYEHVEKSDEAIGMGKPLWASEFSSLAHDVGAEPLARVFNRSYIDARITGQMIWSPVSAWYPTLPIADTGAIVAEWPWSGYYDLGKSVWSLAHTTQFTAPGWHYLDGGSRRLPSGATVVSLAAPDAEHYSIILEAMDVAEPTAVAFTLENLPDRALQLWVTNLASGDPDDHFRHAGTIETDGGRFRLEIEPAHLYTISTRTDAAKGDARPEGSAHAQMPLPFHEDFEEVAEGGLARFFSDVSGGFEAAPGGGDRGGTVYRQVIGHEPIAWHGPDMPPTTLVGDPRWWGDYEVGVDVLLEDDGYVELLGRVDGVAGDEFVSGYHLRLAADGSWTLYSQNIAGETFDVADGDVPFRANRWHRIGMRFEGEEVEVLFDGEAVATAPADRHRVGQIGLGTGAWDRAQFDDVRVEKTAEWPQFVPQSDMTATASSAHEGNAFGYDYPASAAIDGRPETYWRSEWEPPAALPQAITLDLGSAREVGALTYQPRISGHWAARDPGNTITQYAIAVSTDGTTFEQVAEGTWADTLAATKVADFGGTHRARFVRLTAVDGAAAEDPSVTAGEINVSLTPIE